MAKKNSFEVQLKQLEDIVGQLESGELDLDTSIKSFESGIKLISACQKTLADAEQKVEILTSKSQPSDDHYE